MTINWGNPSGTQQSVPAAGWYPDPNGLQTQRWWDGARWTEQLAPMPQTYARDEPMIVTRSPRRTSHGLHLFLTIITCGLWLPVWIFMSIINKVDKEKSVSRVYR